MQPQWEKMQQAFSSTLTVNYKMAGLIPSWNNFNDSLNSIRRPSHMGPEWMHAKATTGTDIDNRIWIVDPPASSFPACIAVKCAELQSPAAGARYFRVLQQAVMTRNLNIAHTEILLELARQYSQTDPLFNLFLFQEDLLGEKGKDAFRKDWQETKYRGITRLPTLIFRSTGQKPVVLSGFQPYELLENTALSMGPILP